MALTKSIRLLFSEILLFWKSDFHALSYTYTFVFISLSIYFNYSYDFYASAIRGTYFTGDSIWVLPLFYSVVYFAVAIPILYFQKEENIVKNKVFYFKSLFFIVLYGFSNGFFDYINWQFPSLSTDERMFTFRIFSQIKGTLIFIIPVLILKLTIDRKVEGIYGLTRNSEHLQAYLMLFLIILPFIILVSFAPDFMSAYPQYKPWLTGNIFELPKWLHASFYEISYTLDFVNTELLFRGMLVIGMASTLGRKSVLPMVAMYVAIHFGKPMGETISSIFGGYILGALAYQTRHIWGGVIVHICIALSMEIMGLLQYYVFSK